MGCRPMAQWKLDRIRELWDQLSCADIGKRLGLAGATVRTAGIKTGLKGKGKGNGQTLNSFDMEE